MATYDCELFGHMLYSPELSYNELHELESDLIPALQTALTAAGAEHIDLLGQGDALRMQGVLPEHMEADFHALCDTIAAFLPPTVTGRLLFVHKDLAVLHLYLFTEKGWKEAALDVSMGICR